MEITDTIMRRSVAQQRFGSFKPFVTGDEQTVAAFSSGSLVMHIGFGGLGTGH